MQKSCGKFRKLREIAASKDRIKQAGQEKQDAWNINNINENEDKQNTGSMQKNAASV